MPKKKEKPRAQIRPEIAKGPIGSARPAATYRHGFPGGKIMPAQTRPAGTFRHGFPGGRIPPARPSIPAGELPPATPGPISRDVNRKRGMGTPPTRKAAVRPPVIKHGREIITPGRRREEWRRRRAS